jgi:CheY-like chemotaxis protein
MSATGGTKVLVADDEQVIADTLTMILNQAGFEAWAVYSGEKAIETAHRFQPDIFISDVFMTGITGIEAAIEVRAVARTCEILLFSGEAVDCPIFCTSEELV